MSDTSTAAPKAALPPRLAIAASFLGEIARPVALIAVAAGVTTAVIRGLDATLVGTAGAVLCTLAGIKGAENAVVSFNAGKVQTAAVQKSETAAQTIATAAANTNTPPAAAGATPGTAT